jgi:hypothetical protein
MKPVDLEVQAALDQCDLIRFIEENSENDWNEGCDIVKKIFHGDISFFDRSDYKEKVTEDHDNYWITEFFHAHPNIPDSIMFYFNN